MSNNYQAPMANGEDHPLKNVDPAILEAARAELRSGAEWKDISPDMAEPLADSVVMALLPFLDAHRKLAEIKEIADIIGDSHDADIYIDYLFKIYKLASKGDNP